MYSVLSRNGDESFNAFLSPDPDHPRGPSHEDNTSCVQKIESIGATVVGLHAWTNRQADQHAQIHNPRTPLRGRGL